ncbi:hypothetical protein [Collimonas humicola]|uniref:hypothetical protein n=1 Tax=Collimonas humicola TaxID=2825886 RepID=UPI001B8AF2BE|nr:hypothetical protein [Collimonas humicola]
MTQERVTIREACRRRMPLGGVDAEMLEHGLTQVEAELAAAAERNAALVAAITGLLECAELSQDDLEGDTRYMIENARTAIGKAGGA